MAEWEMPWPFAAGARVRAVDHAPNLVLCGEAGTVLDKPLPNLPGCVLVRWDLPSIGEKPINSKYIRRI